MLRRLLAAALSAATVLAVPAIAAAPNPQGFRNGTYINAIAQGPDGAVWFTDATRSSGARLGRVTATGRITRLPLPKGMYVLGKAMAPGPGHALWFGAGQEQEGGDPVGLVGRMTTSGKVTTFPLPEGFRAEAITTGPDHNLWLFLTSGTTNKSFTRRIARMTPAGTLREFSLGTVKDRHYGQGESIATGRDGALWFTDSLVGKIGRITTSGKIREFNLRGFWRPGCADAYKAQVTCTPAGITRGPGSGMWFYGTFGNKIVHISGDGALRAYTIPWPSAGYANIKGMAAGPGGTLWFVTGTTVGRFSPTGGVRQWPITGHAPFRANSFPHDIAAGRDGAMWFIANTMLGRAR